MRHLSDDELRRLREVRRRMDWWSVPAPCSFGHDTKEDAHIKESVRIYIQTWVLPGLDEVIKRHEEARRRYKEAIDGDGC